MKYVDKFIQDNYLEHKPVDKVVEATIREVFHAIWTEECNTSDTAYLEYRRIQNLITNHFNRQINTRCC